MGFRVTSSLLEDWVKIAELAGADPFVSTWHPGTSELEVESVDQATLDTAHAAYLADQVNIDAATRQAQINATRDVDKNNYDAKRVLQAMAELLVDEINTLRQQFNTTTGQINVLPGAGSVTVTTFDDRTVAQARSAIRNKIDNL
jgi:hypothetical protein